MPHYAIPTLYRPTPPQLHPDVELLDERSMKWMRSHGFCGTSESEQAVTNIMGPHLAAAWFPEQAADRVQWVSDFTCFALHLDDERLEAGEHATALLGSVVAEMPFVLANPRSYRRGDLFSPALEALHDINWRAHKLSTPAQAGRYTSGFGYWLLGLLSDDSGGRAGELGEVLLRRMSHSGGPFMLDIINVACSEPLSADEWHDPKVVAAGHAAMLTQVLDNDLISYGKERFLADVDGRQPTDNLVTYFTTRGLDMAQAFEAVADFRNRAMCLWQHLYAELLPLASPTLTAFLRAVDLTAAGNNQHHSTSSRYHNPDGKHPHAITFDITYTARCPVTEHLPPAHSVSWWWQQLDGDFH